MTVILRMNDEHILNVGRLSSEFKSVESESTVVVDLAREEYLGSTDNQILM